MTKLRLFQVTNPFRHVVWGKRVKNFVLEGSTEHRGPSCRILSKIVLGREQRSCCDIPEAFSNLRGVWSHLGHGGGLWRCMSTCSARVCPT